MQSQPPVRQKIIREIKPSPVLQARTKNHKLRVAAYCRVSTEQEEQQTSIENQITYYEDLIRSNPEWEYAGVFSDDGISPEHPPMHFIHTDVKGPGDHHPL